MSGVFEELRRRHVFKVAAAYAVVAWLLAQAASIAFPAFGAPEWVLRVTIFLLIAGFPIALLLAWAYNLQPEGAAQASASAPTTGRAPLFYVLFGAVLLVAVALFAWQKWGAPKRGSDTSEVRLAVLPLVNLSGDPSQAYFSDGITEEIIGKLSNLGGLAVAARTSVEKYRNAPPDVRTIGKELGVDYVVEGSVRRNGDRIRVQTTLVKTADSFEVWSQDIPATIDDVFAVQERVANAIVQSLGVKLTPAQKRSLGNWGTHSPAAYDEYLQGRALVIYNHDRPKLESAITHFEHALAIDASFVPALAGMAEAEGHYYRNFDSSPERLQRAQQLLERARGIDPDFDRVLYASGQVSAIEGDFEKAAEYFRQLVAREPQDAHFWDSLCWALGYTEPPQLEEAAAACARSLAIRPDFMDAYYHLARVQIAQGRFADAEKSLKLMHEYDPGSMFEATGEFWLNLAKHRPQAAIAALERQGRPTILTDSWYAMALAQEGNLDGAFARLEKSLAGGYREEQTLARSPYFESMRRDPRFAALMAKYKITLPAS